MPPQYSGIYLIQCYTTRGYLSMNKKHHIFVSYKSQEREFAGKLFLGLQSRGIPVWMDKDKEVGIAVSENFINAIDAALKVSVGLIVIVTPEYFESKFCKDELDSAYRNNLTIFPIILREPLEGIMPQWLSGIQSLDFTARENEADYYQGVEELIKQIKKSVLFDVDTPSAKAPTLEDLIKHVELNRDNPGRLVNDFIESLWGSVRHEKGWMKLERTQDILGQIARKMLDRFESDSGIMELESAIRYSIRYVSRV